VKTRILGTAVLALVFAGCATTNTEAAKDVKVAGPKAQEGDTAGTGEGGQPQINAHAKLLFDDANKTYDTQKKQGKPDWPALQRKYRAALDADQNLAEAEYDLGVIAERQGNTEEAVAHYKAALARKRTLKEAAENLAVIAQNGGNVKDAVTVYQRILEQYPDDASSRARLAEIYREQNDVDHALDLAKQALVRDPKSVPAYKVMLLCYLDQKQLALAKLIALRTIKLAEGDPELYHAMGLILVAEKEPEKALLQFKKAVEVRADYLPSRVILARLAMEKENYSEAEEHLRRILQSDAKNCSVHLNLGVAYKGLGQFDKAMQEYDVAAGLCGDNPAIQLNKGIILHRFKNQPGQAIDYYNKYISMQGGALPADHPVHALLAEAQQLIEADKQAKIAEEQAKKMEAEQKANEQKAKLDEANKKDDKGKGAPAEDAAKDANGDAAKAPPAGGDKPAGKGTTKPAKGGDAKPDAKPTSASANDAPSAAAAPAAPAKAAPVKQPPPAKPTGDEPSEEPKEGN
jgi:tetratricopeptide (TPR) repeat protein